MKKIIFLSCLFLLLSFTLRAQEFGIKTNLLYGALTLTPNLGAEIGVGNRSTLSLSGSYNPWNLKGSAENNKKMVHWLVGAEYRYWLCEKFNGHFFGLHALGGRSNIGGYELPFWLEKDSKNYRYEGLNYGAGISYGYQWILNNRWSLEAILGLGYMRMDYTKYDCKTCGKKIGTFKKNYLGPTNAGISIIYMIK